MVPSQRFKLGLTLAPRGLQCTSQVPNPGWPVLPKAALARFVIQTASGPKYDLAEVANVPKGFCRPSSQGPTPFYNRGRRMQPRALANAAHMACASLQNSPRWPPDHSEPQNVDSLLEPQAATDVLTFTARLDRAKCANAGIANKSPADNAASDPCPRLKALRDPSRYVWFGEVPRAYGRGLSRPSALRSVLSPSAPPAIV